MVDLAAQAIRFGIDVERAPVDEAAHQHGGIERKPPVGPEVVALDPLLARGHRLARRHKLLELLARAHPPIGEHRSLRVLTILTQPHVRVAVGMRTRSAPSPPQHAGKHGCRRNGLRGRSTPPAAMGALVAGAPSKMGRKTPGTFRRRRASVEAFDLASGEASGSVSTLASIVFDHRGVFVFRSLRVLTVLTQPHVRVAAGIAHAVALHLRPQHAGARSLSTGSSGQNGFHTTIVPSPLADGGDEIIEASLRDDCASSTQTMSMSSIERSAEEL